MNLSDDQVQALRHVFVLCAAHFDNLDHWLIGLEQGQVPASSEVAVLRGGATTLRELMATAAQALPRS